MKPKIRGQFIKLAAGVLVALGCGGPGLAQETVEQRLQKLERQNEELRKQTELLLKQNQNLLGLIGSGQISNGQTSPGSSPSLLRPEDVRQIVTGYLAEKEEQKNADMATMGDGWHEVGKNLGLTASWTGHQPWLETADKAFRIHVGGRTQFDFVGTGAPENVKFGMGGIGPYENAVNFRRARLEIDGWIYDNIDFFCEYDFINTFNFNTDPKAPGARESTVANTPVPTDLWASINFLPVIGSVRVGNLKNPIGLDHLTSSRYLDFLERSPGFDAYYNRQNGFVPGIMIFNNTEDERMTWQVALTKYNNGVFAWNTGNSEYNVTGRLTWLAWYQDNGRHMVHLGLGAQWGNPDANRVILRDRVLLRNGPAAGLHSTVALADLTASGQSIVNPEFFMNLGPLSIQAEYQATWVNDVTELTTQLQPKTAVSNRSFFGQGAYVQAMYFLTGEHRPYAKTAVHGSGAAPTRVVPYRNFFWTRGHEGVNPFSAGAWQVGARYSYFDLTNNGVIGGQINEVTLGLNWFLNPNLKFQFNYDIGHRSIAGGTSSGTYQAYGMRMALDW